jgi:GGDEF domain-containing protein
VFSLNRKISAVNGRTAAILLQGIAQHAFPSSAVALEQFESDMQALGTRFESVHDDDAAIRLACEAVECLQSYRASTESFIAEEGKQMREAMAQLTASLNLLSLSAELENASPTGDLAALNAGLRRFLGRICNEVDGLRQRNHEILQDLDRAAKLDVDSGTGLPGVSSAVRAIRTALERGLTRHIYAFRIENMEATNRRFGFKAGDQMLLHFAQYVAQRLGADDVLFRWRGPCFVAVSSAAAADVSRILTARLEYSITVASRQVEVPIAGSWNMVKLAPGSSMDEVLLRLDEFAIRGT